MTRKDYILLAEALNEALGYVIEPDETEGVIHAVEFIARALAKDNPRFDRDHFLAVAHGYRALDSRPPR